MVSSQEALVFVIDEPASAATTANKATRPLKCRELAAVRSTKGFLLTVVEDGETCLNFNDLDHKVRGASFLIKELDEDRVTIEVGGGELPLGKGLLGQVLNRPIKQRSDPDHGGIGRGLVKNETDPIST
jgi:hypothetical protein